MESQPLLPGAGQAGQVRPSQRKWLRKIWTLVLPLALIVASGVFLVVRQAEPRDPWKRALWVLKQSPVIDGHIDTPIMVREVYGNDINKIDMYDLPGHSDIPRMRKGHLGGLFWSVYTSCHDDGPDFLTPNNHVRDTLEQIDITKNLITKYASTFHLSPTASDASSAIARGKIASFMGVEGAHQFGNSLASVRMYYELGVRYATLSHSCNNAFADSGGFDVAPKPKWGGLSPLGKELVAEMNRVGMLVDLSHVADTTANQVLDITQAPVMWSHSTARHFNNMSRNLPDSILERVGSGAGRVDGVIMVNFFPIFNSAEPDKVDVAYIADVVEYIASKTSKQNVGIGSDYDGINMVPHGLEDVSKYPYLFAELARRGWSSRDLGGLAGGNILRVMRGAEAVAHRLQGERGPSMAKYDKREDL